MNLTKSNLTAGCEGRRVSGHFPLSHCYFFFSSFDSGAARLSAARIRAMPAGEIRFGEASTYIASWMWSCSC